MKATEVMLNDWIKVYYIDEPVRVLQIEDDAIINNKSFRPDNEFNVDGVVITPAILEANYFDKIPKQDGNFYHRIVNGIIINIEPTIGDQWEVFTTGHGRIEMHIHYIHELQHILRLQGLNDFADNFKIQ